MAANMQGLRKPLFKLLYKGVDITSELAPHVLDVIYTEKLDGEADEIEITVHDKDGIWRGPWCPETGDEVMLWIGYEGEALTFAGKFELDEPEGESSRAGDTFSLSGQSVPVSKAARTTKTKAFENKTVAEIAKDIAGELGLTLIGNPPEIKFERQTQRRERDLEFLARLATSYGCYFAVKGDKMIFEKREELHKHAPVKIFAFGFNAEGQGDYIRASYKRSSDDTYSEGKISHYDGAKKKNHSASEKAKGIKNGNTLRLDERVENEGQAKARVKSELEKKNLNAQTAQIETEGNPLLSAGQMVELGYGFGKWAGKYVIWQSRHKLSRGSSYTTDIELKSPEAAAKDAKAAASNKEE